MLVLDPDLSEELFDPSPPPPAETLMATVEYGEPGRLMEGARRGNVGGEGLAVILRKKQCQRHNGPTVLNT